VSAFAVIWHRNGLPVSAEVLEGMSRELSVRGPDGGDQLTGGWIGMAHQSFWTTPEEDGERQPLSDSQGDVLLVFDGRLDNREELLAVLGPEASTDRGSLSDAELVLASYRLWGEEFCRRLIGPYALVIGDLERRQVLCARDPLGDRTLFYHLTGDKLLAASEESALLAHPEIGRDLDETRVACFFALQVPADGSTFFRQIRELLPGELLHVCQDSVRRTDLWHPPQDSRLPERCEADLTEEFRELLRLAVRSRLRAAGPPAVMMSGGLDSTSAAALGAEELQRRHPDWRLRTVSWVFDEFASCDERSFMDPVVERWNLEALRVNGDDAVPLRHAHVLCRHPSAPEDNVYRELKRRALARAAQAGSRVVLNCASADALYTGGERWLMDLVHAGHACRAMWELAVEVRGRGIREALRRCDALRWPARVKRTVLRRRAPESPWLTPVARRGVTQVTAPRFETPRGLRANQLEAVAGLRMARSYSLENAYAGRLGIELRDPYRDLRLVEFMLRLPAHLLYRHGRYKHVARQALIGWLPDSILRRTDPTLLTPLFEEGLRRENRQVVEELLGSRDALWPRYVERRWAEGSLRESISPALDVVLWRCVSFELWRQHRSSTASSDELPCVSGTEVGSVREEDS
jgi:asparagine synthase (glutamine-hydrolysing)